MSFSGFRAEPLSAPGHVFPAEKAFADRVHADGVSAAFLDALLRHGTTSALVFATVHQGSAAA